jgi:hypothetical protein
MLLHPTHTPVCIAASMDMSVTLGYTKAQLASVTHRAIYFLRYAALAVCVFYNRCTSQEYLIYIIQIIPHSKYTQSDYFRYNQPCEMQA